MGGVTDIPLSLEQAFLGMCLASSEARKDLAAISADDFIEPRHALLAATMRAMARDGKPIDFATVGADLASRNELIRMPGASTTYLYRLYSQAPPAVMSHAYADMLRNAARVRGHRAAAQRLVDHLSADDADENLEVIMREFHRSIADIPGLLDDADPDARLLSALMGQPDRPTDWLVPGLLSRGERVVITGREGIAKSVLLRQLSVAVACGVHPWTGLPVAAPSTVLHVDVENSASQIRRGYRMAARAVTGTDYQRHITIHVRPEGIDLLGRDSGWFAKVADDCHPDLIVVGPAYKMMRGDPQRDTDVLAMLAVIDEIRVRHDAAVIIEHHSPHAMDGTHRTVRPYGSSVWLRWPEVGFGVRRDESIPAEQQRPRPEYLECVEWRGSREPRDWPARICYGSDREFPWVPTDGGYRPSHPALHSVA